MFDITTDFTSNPSDGSVDVVLNNIDNAPMHYTLDGTTPTINSPVYVSALKIKESVNLKAAIFRNQEAGKIISENIQFSKSTAKPITALEPLAGSFQFKGVSTLVDGLSGTKNYKTGRWIGFYQNDMNVVIDLGKITSIQDAAISTCVEKGDWIFDARSFSVEVSTDGVNFTPVASENYPAMQQQDANGVFNHKLSFSPVQTRYVKVLAATEKSIPEWHGGKGNPGFLFVDEITLN